MAQISQYKVADLLYLCDNGPTKISRGQALEDLTCYLFEKVPGLSVNARNHLDFAISEEIDIALWNDKYQFLPPVILIECKNWTLKVGSNEIREFESKLRERGLPFGIFVAINGITGDPTDLTSAHNVIAGALRDGTKIILFTRVDITNAVSSTVIIEKIKNKFCELAVSRTSFR